MGFGEAIKKVFKNYANFNGRARRSEYWYWYLFTLLVSLVLNGVGQGVIYMVNHMELYTGSASSVISNGLAYAWEIAIFIPSLALQVRRLHDINKSGWYILVSLIPIVGWIIMLVWMLRDSDKGANEYGNSEKYPSLVVDGAYVAYPAQPVDPQQGGYYAPNQYQPNGEYYAPVQPPQQDDYYSPQNPNSPVDEQ